VSEISEAAVEAASDLPDEAVEAAAQSMPYQVEDRYEVAREALAAAAPHLRADGEYRRAIRAWVDAGMPSETSIRADERARVLTEVQAALRDGARFSAWRRARSSRATLAGYTAADYLRDTVEAKTAADELTQQLQDWNMT